MEGRKSGGEEEWRGRRVEGRKSGGEEEWEAWERGYPLLFLVVVKLTNNKMSGLISLQT